MERNRNATIGKLIFASPERWSAVPAPAAGKMRSPTMAHPLSFAVAVSAALVSSTGALAQDTLAPAGFTGLTITPNAHLLGWGRAAFSYDRTLPGVVFDPAGHNYVLGFGLLPNLEIVGRLATNNMDRNCFTQGCGARDLSASAKAGIGLDATNRWRVAAGVTDVGGAATYYRAYYGVLTFDDGPWQFSGGLARRSGPGTRGSRSALDGPFASAAWQPLPWLRGHVEYSDSNAWAGVRAFLPEGWLPEGWSVHVGVNARLTDTDLTRRTWVAAGLSIPLYKVPRSAPANRQAPLPALAGTQQPLPAYEARSLPPSAPSAPVQAAPPATVNDEALRQLAEALRARGLEDISVGRVADGSVAVRANNATYNWNTADAIGAALGAIGDALAPAKAVYRLVLTQRQQPIVGVTGRADCLAQWIAGTSQSCTAGELSTPGTTVLDSLHEGARWVVQGLQPSWQTARIGLSPVLRTTVGTEYGAVDYSAGVSAALVQPLWSGASAEWRVQRELARSEDFAAGGIFGNRRVVNGTERLVLTQTLRVPLERLAAGDALAIRRYGLAAVTGQASLGRIGGQFDGALGSLRWEPGDGAHRLAVHAGTFRNARFGEPGAVGPQRATPILADYRYHVGPTRTYLEATAGRFMYNDLGFQLGLRQWFSDVSVGLFYRRTRFENASAREFAGIEVTVPIGPRRDMNPRLLQVTGTPRFGHSVATVIRDPNNQNPVSFGYGVVPPAPSLEGTFNSDRAGLRYFEDNIRRIRDAAR